MRSGCEGSRAGHGPRIVIASVGNRFVAALLLCVLGFSAPRLGHATTPLTYAGLAYAGNSINISSRFKYSKRYEARLKGQGLDINAKLLETVKGGRYPL